MPWAEVLKVSRFNSCLLYVDIIAYARKPPNTAVFSYPTAERGETEWRG